MGFYSRFLFPWLCDVAETVAGTGITVNSVLPGPTESEGVATFVAATAGFWFFYRNPWPLALSVPVLMFLAAYPLLKCAPRHGRVVVIGSKNVPAPGPGGSNRPRSRRVGVNRQASSRPVGTGKSVIG